MKDELLLYTNTLFIMTLPGAHFTTTHMYKTCRKTLFSIIYIQAYSRLGWGKGWGRSGRIVLLGLVVVVVVKVVMVEAEEMVVLEVVLLEVEVVDVRRMRWWWRWCCWGGMWGWWGISWWRWI